MRITNRLALAFFGFSLWTSASPVFTAASANCGSGSSNGYSGTVQTTPLLASNDVQGISLSGGCTAFFATGEIGSGYDLFASMSGGSGGPDLFPADSIHIAWDFTPDSDDFASVDWLVWVTINGSVSQFGGTADPGFAVTGEGDVSVPQGGTLDSWEAGVAFSQADRINSDTNLFLTIPSQSLDIGVQVNTVPEPEFALPMLAGLGLLAFRLRCRRRYDRSSAGHVPSSL